MNRRTDAFTLLESVVVLAIVTMLFLMTVPSASRSRQLNAERQFFSDFRVQWQAAQTRAKVKHRQTEILYDPDSRDFEFMWLDQHQRIELVKVPSTMVVDYYPRLRVLANGFVHPQTIYLHSTLTRQRYEIRVQLGWGGYHVVEK